MPHQCTGSPTFNETYSGAFSEWPENLPGYICKTPPFGYYNAPRFARCCSGTVYNITSPTTPGDPAYPVTCALLCQVDPALDENNSRYPHHWSDYFMCLTNGGTEPSNWDVFCGTVTVKSEPAPTSFGHTPSGSWMTKSYDLNSWGDPQCWVFSDVASDTAMTSPESSATMASMTGFSGIVSTSAAVSSSISSPPSTSMDNTAAATRRTTTPTSTSSGDALSLKRVATTGARYFWALCWMVISLSAL